VISVDLSELYPELEVCCFAVIFSGVKCRIFAAYRAPSLYHSDSERLLDCLNLFSKVKHHSIITWDFNCGDIDWNTLTAPPDGVQDILLKFSTANGFSQMIQAATRADNLLDFVFGNEPLGICNVNVSNQFGTSDHCQVEFSVFIDCTMQTHDRKHAKRFDWNNADFDGISSIAAFNWLDMLATNITANSVWCAFSDVLHTAIDMYVPIKPARNAAIKNRRWYPAALRHAISKKMSLWDRKRRDANNVINAKNY
jgi:Endonuclease-reverse transcriptase